VADMCCSAAAYQNAAACSSQLLLLHNTELEVALIELQRI
jgi:hypothetical protein